MLNVVVLNVAAPLQDCLAKKFCVKLQATVTKKDS